MKLSDNDTVCVYPNEEEIDKMVEDFTKELNISSKVKKIFTIWISRRFV